MRGRTSEEEAAKRMEKEEKSTEKNLK